MYAFWEMKLCSSTTTCLENLLGPTWGVSVLSLLHSRAYASQQHALHLLQAPGLTALVDDDLHSRVSANQICQCAAGYVLGWRCVSSATKSAEQLEVGIEDQTGGTYLAYLTPSPSPHQGAHPAPVNRNDKPG